MPPPFLDKESTRGLAIMLAALAGLLTGLPSAGRVAALWEEYEAGASQEAVFVRACDRLDMALQAARYAAGQSHRQLAPADTPERSAPVAQISVLAEARPSGVAHRSLHFDALSRLSVIGHVHPATPNRSCHTATLISPHSTWL